MISKNKNMIGITLPVFNLFLQI